MLTRAISVVCRHAQGIVIARRSLAKKAAKKKTVTEVAGAVSAKVLDSNTVAGLNILKDGADPAIQDDAAYPEWVWKL